MVSGFKQSPPAGGAIVLWNLAVRRSSHRRYHPSSGEARGSVFFKISVPEGKFCGVGGNVEFAQLLQFCSFVGEILGEDSSNVVLSFPKVSASSDIPFSGGTHSKFMFPSPTVGSKKG